MIKRLIIGNWLHNFSEWKKNNNHENILHVNKSIKK